MVMLAIALVAGMTTAMVAPVHEEVYERTEQEQDVWDRAEDVRLVFCPQEEERDSEEQAEAHYPRDVKRPLLGIGSRFRLHVMLPC
jgi:hypothetical protein